MRNIGRIAITIGIVCLSCFIIAAGSEIHNSDVKRNGQLLPKELKELPISYEEVSIPGLKKEYHLFFTADAHISLCDNRDQSLLESARQRQELYTNADGTTSPEAFDQLIQAANTMNTDLFLMGGDILDSATWASVDYLKEELQLLNMPWMYDLGNHDFEYGEEYFSDTAYEEYLPRLQDLCGKETYQMKEYEDLVIFSSNDHNNQIDETSLEGLKTAIAKGKPLVVVLHVPIEPLTDDDSLLQQSIEGWGESKHGGSRVLLGEDGCRPNETTQEFLDLVTEKDSPVRLVLAGHIHFYHKDYLKEGLLQIVTGAGFQKNALYVTLKPENV